MEPLFNLYGHQEAEATQYFVSDEDIIKAKALKEKALLDKIQSTQILSPRDAPDADLYNFCKDKVHNVLASFAKNDDTESKKYTKYLQGDLGDLDRRVAAYLAETNNVMFLAAMEENGLHKEQFDNCLGVIHHFEFNEELPGIAYEKESEAKSDAPFYKKHPYITGGIILGLLIGLSKRR